MTITLQPNEKIIKKGAANHWKGPESVGGKLFLTNQRLYFSSHSLNVQAHTLSIPLENIQKLEKHSSLGIVPNGLSITTTESATEKFVLWGREKWIVNIEAQKQQNKST